MDSDKSPRPEQDEQPEEEDDEGKTPVPRSFDDEKSPAPTEWGTPPESLTPSIPATSASAAADRNLAMAPKKPMYKKPTATTTLKSKKAQSMKEHASKTTGGWQPSKKKAQSARRRSPPNLPPLRPIHSIPMTQNGYDLSPYLHHPRGGGGHARPTMIKGGRKKSGDWFEFVDEPTDFEEAWIGLRERLHYQLFEQIAIPLPYIRDAMFYNLNCVILKKRMSITSLPMLFPAGSLFRLGKSMTRENFESLSGSKGYEAGQWFTREYYTRDDAWHNKLEKEVQLHINGIFRISADPIKPGSIQLDMDALNQIYSFSERSIFDDWLRTPKAPSVQFFKDIVEPGAVSDSYEFNPAEMSVSTPLPGHSRVLQMPEPKPPKKPLSQLLGARKCKSIYVINELLVAQSILLTLKIGNREEQGLVRNFLYDGHCFPIGFILMKYKVDKNGFLTPVKQIYGHKCIDLGWNVAVNLPWPDPPCPTIMGEEEPELQPESDEQHQTDQRQSKQPTPPTKFFPPDGSSKKPGFSGWIGQEPPIRAETKFYDYPTTPNEEFDTTIEKGNILGAKTLPTSALRSPSILDPNDTVELDDLVREYVMNKQIDPSDLEGTAMGTMGSFVAQETATNGGAAAAAAASGATTDGEPKSETSDQSEGSEGKKEENVTQDLDELLKEHGLSIGRTLGESTLAYVSALENDKTLEPGEEDEKQQEDGGEGK